MKRAVLMLGVAFAIATAGISCTSSDALQKALEDITDDDLAIMVLPAEELGDDYADLEVSSDSGYVSNADAAEDSFSSETTEGDLDELGRVNGYDLTYNDPDFLFVGTSVALFEDADGASEFLSRERDDAEEAEGEVEDGFSLDEVETEEVAGLGDEATRIRLLGSSGALELNATAVYLRLDRIVSFAAIGQADDEVEADEVERIAGLLEDRIRGVLLGDVTGTPVPVPEGGGVEDADGREAELNATSPAGSTRRLLLREPLSSASGLVAPSCSRGSSLPRPPPSTRPSSR